MISEREKQKLLPPAGGRHSSAAAPATISFGMEDDQGRKRLFAISTNHPLSSQPDFRPALTSPFEDRHCFPAGNLACQSPSFAVAEDSRSAKFSRLSKRFFEVVSLLQLQLSPGASLKLAS